MELAFLEPAPEACPEYNINSLRSVAFRPKQSLSFDKNGKHLNTLSYNFDTTLSLHIEYSHFHYQNQLFHLMLSS